MQQYLVQSWPNGIWDGKDYQSVEANSAQEAAEKTLREPLNDKGNAGRIRAQVRSIIFGDGRPAQVFYEA